LREAFSRSGKELRIAECGFARSGNLATRNPQKSQSPITPAFADPQFAISSCAFGFPGYKLSA
jgi:hypothetical protein